MVTRGSVLPITENDKVPAILASLALFDRLAPQYAGGDGAYVKLRSGASAEAFRQRAQALTRQFPDTGGRVDVADERAQAAAVQHAIRPQAVALALFALVLGVTALLIVGQAAARLLATASPDIPALAALGMTRGQLMAAGLIEVGAAGARVANLLKEAGLAASTSEANRKIEEGAVKIDGARVTDRGLVLGAGAEHVLQVGSRRFARLRLTAKG